MDTGPVSSDPSRAELLRLMIHQVKSIKRDVLARSSNSQSDLESPGLHHDHRDGDYGRNTDGDYSDSSKHVSRTHRHEGEMSFGVGQGSTPHQTKIGHGRRHSIGGFTSESEIVLREEQPRSSNKAQHRSREEADGSRGVHQMRARTPPPPSSLNPLLHPDRQQLRNPAMSGNARPLFNPSYVQQQPQQHASSAQPIPQSSSMHAAAVRPIVFMPSGTPMREATVVGAPQRLRRHEKPSKHSRRSQRSNETAGVMISLATTEKEARKLKHLSEKMLKCTSNMSEE